MASLSSLAELGPEVIPDIAAHTRLAEVQAGAEILGHRQADRDVYFLLRGRVRINMVATSGRQITYDILDPGEMFGELAAIDGQPRSASVLAEDQCTLGVLSGQHLLELCARHPALALCVMQRLARLARGLAAKVFEYHTFDVRGRVYSELLRRHDASGSKDGGISAITAKDMASRVGTTRENASRILKHLSEEGIISRDASDIRVLDPGALSVLLEASEFG